MRLTIVTVTVGSDAVLDRDELERELWNNTSDSDAVEHISLKPGVPTWNICFYTRAWGVEHADRSGDQLVRRTLASMADHGAWIVESVRTVI
ncbi:hypothetical protein [Glycomyces xiaoerkulensis]|uniref:hypothetical protein n=1 Tax=Glycomyces xiaoerkulensis TaxID=2038139 RepID=UPI000C261FD0|nr:hypothetical protein [Glycomyces xiaoerkulensis]